MKVQRISEQSLRQILDGKTKDAVSIIKFYSLGCDFCHALSEYYTGLAKEEKYADVNFFAYNIDEDDLNNDETVLPRIQERVRDNKSKERETSYAIWKASEDNVFYSIHYTHFIQEVKWN